ncbi:FAD-dependent oxidoreductase [Streptomyces sp. S.PNR 29]|uniref:flavin monoamine oxidase family protein n=1 Tax=Streptomyces sp. S.PNR 29 TaxID=2973805 RepID=UPI0025AF2C59|nr:FAD-dependent oxidoreductase [Streptomyces sp. S.PNR 29]MDN0200483.1 FAD-dependent oxidoreductase [Streptomyces sp. S.PNR 29]
MGALGLAPDARAAGSPSAYVPPRAGDFTGGRRPARVVILGAGVAGLTTAYELGKAGYDCRILEAKSRPGGRNWTVRGGTRERESGGVTQRARFASGQYLNAGPARIAQHMITLDYCRELGVAIEPFANKNADAYVYLDKIGTPLRHRTVQADTYGYVSELLAKAADRGALDKELSAEDRERLLTFVEDFGQIGGREDGWAYRGGTRRGYRTPPGAAGDTGERYGAPPSLEDVFARASGRYISFEFDYDQAMMMFQPVGGMDRIVRAFVDRIGERRITYGAVAGEIRDRGTGVEVRYKGADGREHVERADFCVAALPPHVLARTAHNLGAGVGSALRVPRPLAVGKLGLEYRRRWWEEDHRIYGGITETDLPLTHVWYPSHGFHSERGIVVGYYHYRDDAVAFGQLPPAERIRRAVALGERIHGPAYRRELDSGFAVAWHRIEHIEAGWIEWPENSGAAYELLNQPSGRVYLAGDWLTQYIGWQAGAISSARRAVSLLHARAVGA